MDDAESFAHPAQDLHSLLQMLMRVRSAHDGTDARLTFRGGGECNARRHQAFLEQFPRELHRQSPFADNDGGDRCFALGSVLSTDVEAEIAEFLLEEVRVVPKLLDEFRLLLQHVKCCDAGGGDRRWMRSREQERPAPVVEELDQVARAADVSPECPDSLDRKSTRLNS